MHRHRVRPHSLIHRALVVSLKNVQVAPTDSRSFIGLVAADIIQARTAACSTALLCRWAQVPWRLRNPDTTISQAIDSDIS